MLGTIHVVPSAGHALHRIIMLEEIPPRDRLAALIGGTPKVLSDFDTILRGGEAEPCLVFYNKQADQNQKDLPQNTWANLLWLQSQIRTHGFAGTNKGSATLTGPVAIAYGDTEFLEALQNILA